MTAPSSIFATTRWTLVLRARGTTPEARAALGELCEAYWDPVFRFLRREGRDEDTARELTQEFFSRLLARAGVESVRPELGRFRSYLLGALKHFLADARDRESRLKRGGGVTLESLDAPGTVDGGEPWAIPDPVAGVNDAVFDRAWAVAVMDRAVRALSGEFADAGRERQFAVLHSWLGGGSGAGSQAEAAQALGMSEGAVKVAIHRLRRRFRDLIRREIAQTVSSEDEVDAELRYLIEVLGQAT